MATFQSQNPMMPGVPESLPRNDVEAADIKSNVSDIKATVKSKVDEVGQQVNQKADAAMTSMGDGLSSVARGVRQSGPAINDAASRTAQTIERAGNYLRESDLKDVGRDFGDMVKQHPVPSLLVAAGVGFLFARAMRR